jgi:hypothetical protein
MGWVDLEQLRRAARSALVAVLFAAALPATAGACIGDCDSSGGVSTGELVRAVRLSLGRGDAPCEAVDSNRDGAVAIDELIAAVAASVSRCGGLPLPTATPTPTPTSIDTATSTATPTATSTPTGTPTTAPPLRVDGLWRESETRSTASNCDPLVEEVRLQLFPLRDCEFPIEQDGHRATFYKECRPEREYEGDVDANGVVTGTTAIRSAQQGCRIDLEVRFSYAMGGSPSTGDYALRWEFSSSCRPLSACEQALRTTLTRLEESSVARGNGRR